MKTHFSEAKPLVLSDQSYKSFENVRLIEELWYAVNIQKDTIKKDGLNEFSSTSMHQKWRNT